MFRPGTTAVGPVGSGIDCMLMQDNQITAFSTELRVNEDYRIEGIQTLGFYGYRNLMSLGYNLEFDLGTFLLRGADIAGNLSLPGWQADGSININTGHYTFTGLDVSTLTVLFTILGAMYGGGSLAVAQGELMSRATKWRGRMMLPGLQTS
jgi:hypothetical protein